MTYITRPYSDEDDDSLPDYVKKLSAKKRRQWVAIFNSVYSKCIDKGGDKSKCETAAFRQANGVVIKKEDMRGVNMNVKSLLNTIRSKLTGKEPLDELNRATGVNSLYSQIWAMVYAKDEHAWVTDILVEDDGSLSAIISADGKFFKSVLTLKDDGVEMGEWVQVKVDYTEVAQSKSRITIQRLADGKVRWLSVSGSAVLNRMGQIDSKKLFDSFVQHIEETGEYGDRMFCHLGEDFIIGKIDFVARDENLLITSGLYNDSELAQKDIAAHEKDPDYWGESIGFKADEYDMVELVEGISVPVYTKGVLRETSSVPEKYAAAWFTKTTEKEVSNMLDERQKEAFVKLFDGDEEAANKWLADNVDEANRMIVDGGMITRAQVEPPVTETPVVPVEPPSSVEPPAQATTEPPPVVPVEQVVELDDAAVNAIVSQITERQSDDLKAIKDSIAALSDRITAVEKKVSDYMTDEEKMKQQVADFEQRLNAEHAKPWYDDLPVATKLRVTHRPRDGAPTDVTPPAPPEPDTFASVAENTLQQMNERIKY